MVNGAGRFKHRIEVYQPSEPQYGQSQVLKRGAKLWAGVLGYSSSNTQSAGAQAERVDYTFVVRDQPNIPTADSWIKFKGTFYDVIHRRQDPDSGEWYIEVTEASPQPKEAAE